MQGKKIALYPIAKLEKELSDAGYPRDAQTIRKWEVAGVTPQATFRSGKKRLYHQKQIDAFVRVAKECNIRQGVDLGKTDFSERIWEELEKVADELREIGYIN